MGLHFFANLFTHHASYSKGTEEIIMVKLFKELAKIVTVVAMCSFLITGCNTFKGVGKDITAAGHALEKTAEKAEKKLTE